MVETHSGAPIGPLDLLSVAFDAHVELNSQFLSFHDTALFCSISAIQLGSLQKPYSSLGFTLVLK
jgi:hypothetical protein